METRARSHWADDSEDSDWDQPTEPEQSKAKQSSPAPAESEHPIKGQIRQMPIKRHLPYALTLTLLNPETWRTRPE